MRTSALFGAKTSDVSNLCMSVLQEGCACEDIFSDKGRGVNFSRFSTDVFYGRSLTGFEQINLPSILFQNILLALTLLQMEVVGALLTS